MCENFCEQMLWFPSLSGKHLLVIAVFLHHSVFVQQDTSSAQQHIDEDVNGGRVSQPKILPSESAFIGG